MPRKFADSNEEIVGIFDFGDEMNKLKDQDQGLTSDDEAIDAGLKDDDDDDDSAPDDLSFHAGMESAKAHIRKIVKQLKTDALRTKAKRRKMNELHMEQKKERLNTLMKRRLPEHVIEELVTPADRPIMAPKTEIGDDAETKEEDDEVIINPCIPLGDFLAFDISERRTGVMAMTVDSVRRVTTSSQQALEFKRTALYGGRIPRQSVNASLALKTKRKAARASKTAKTVD